MKMMKKGVTCFKYPILQSITSSNEGMQYVKFLKMYTRCVGFQYIKYKLDKN